MKRVDEESLYFTLKQGRTIRVLQITNSNKKAVHIILYMRKKYSSYAFSNSMLLLSKQKQGRQFGHWREALRFIEISRKFQKFDKLRSNLKMTSEVKDQYLLCQDLVKPNKNEILCLDLHF